MVDLFRTLFLFAVLAALVIFISSTVATSFRNLSFSNESRVEDRTPGKSTTKKVERSHNKNKQGFERSLDLLSDVADDSPLWQ